MDGLVPIQRQKKKMKTLMIDALVTLLEVQRSSCRESHRSSGVEFKLSIERNDHVLLTQKTIALDDDAAAPLATLDGLKTILEFDFSIFVSTEQPEDVKDLMSPGFNAMEKVFGASQLEGHHR